jgi:hypothetical protein
METESNFDAATAQELSGFTAEQARALSYVDPAVGLRDALALIMASAKKGWTSQRLDGPGWREPGDNGNELRGLLEAKGFTVVFDESGRFTSVRW